MQAAVQGGTIFTLRSNLINRIKAGPFKTLSGF